MSLETPWIEDILDFVKVRDWKNVLYMGEILPIEEKSRYLWAWPNEDNIYFLRNYLNQLSIKAIVSVGCGSGLLEWVLQESLKVPVCGIELDRLWWSSKYCPKPFINLNFVDNESDVEELLRNCVPEEIEWDFALLFCYFNNKPAFFEYLRNYKGSTLIIIGPGIGKGRHTDPSPFDLGFEENHENNFLWELVDFSEIGTTFDFIAIYKRKS